MMRFFDAEIIICPKSAAKSSPEHYVNKAKILADQMPNAVYLNQYENTINVETHYQHTAAEIWHQLDGQVDYLIATASSGGTISGIGKHLKEYNKDIQVIMPDPVGSVYYEYFNTKNDNLTASPYEIEGIGKDYVCKNVNFDVIDEVVQVNDKEAFIQMKELAKKEGIFAGMSSGAAMHAALQLCHSLKNSNNTKRVVVILPDTGLKYLSKYFTLIQNNND